MEHSHNIALQAKHAGIDAKIAQESQRPAPDEALLATLKKQKLRLKEEIQKF